MAGAAYRRVMYKESSRACYMVLDNCTAARECCKESGKYMEWHKAFRKEYCTACYKVSSRELGMRKVRCRW